MTDHSNFSPNMSIFYRQNTLPKKVARKLDYEAGFALGVEAGADTDAGMQLQGMLLDARILTARHGSCAAAGRLMHVAEAGLRGFLEGAGYFLEAEAAAPRPCIKLAVAN
jgi:hypothetical protein